ncbi:oxidative stress induced growth inhibitor 1 [Pristis pectinata]|uniref:oxidative stress induced growth inhibitor 1 n=1 Tax=Pristis pectinata TaxID=685728 RepID=UPI00223DB4D5|nr:oxidative stress induced growth inhibitor 1 [Pristis pectinata]XP_051887565.1 oxidative stress induced growth inhibitor 1 [Pristis pectinata]XP_051887566.1 oxidative stress induced growth inhibitor 1 [Pristis pectinata]XP_051887567.1 oxidative stress induced growth inhibitor 1 [Pristis pectinata]XP_051887568.1 oxidative stress induced growth inhibitor 1 [Pristis pectinata]XP_051887569.1 oxidative stress induced growth inhibitor 1 [Pristis pectinata]XP_051887570.1 oxidative stress induced g
MLEDRVLPDDGSLTIPVLVVGNGPSGICLSYLLSGYRPYLSPLASHPNPILQRKLEENRHLSIVDQDLEWLSEGLEGRSSNPVAVLFDTLLLPDGDYGLDHTSPLWWRLEAAQSISHLVLGTGLPGGSWHDMEGSMLTLSFGNWMELPGLKMKDWVSEKRRSLRNDRVLPAEVAAYYQNFVGEMGLEKNFVSSSCVTALRRAGSEGEVGGERCVTRESREDGTCCQAAPSLWEVQGYQTSRDGSRTPFLIRAENVVLATGTHDEPVRLGVEGEDLPYVCHSISELEVAVAQGRLNQFSDPVLIVGAGLTAADAILCAHHGSVPVLHAFRCSVTDPNLIFNQLPKVLYPEYHKVHQMMSQQCVGEEPTSYRGYTSLPQHRVRSFQPDRKCILESWDKVQTGVSVSMALVLIGTNPRLSFLRDNGVYLGLDPKLPISCRYNPLHIHPYTYELVQEPTLFAMGPLVGDNFVRFVKGGALAITSCLVKRHKEQWFPTN